MINYLAVVVAALIPMILGFLWYSRFLFGKQWLAAMGKTEEQVKQAGGQGKALSISFIAALVMSYVLAHFVTYSGAASVLEGYMVGFWAWLGFVAATWISNVLFENRSWTLYFISTGYYLVSLLVMGALLAVWR